MTSSLFGCFHQKNIYIYIMHINKYIYIYIIIYIYVNKYMDESPSWRWKGLISPSNTTGTTSGIPWIFHASHRSPGTPKSSKITVIFRGFRHSSLCYTIFFRRPPIIHRILVGGFNPSEKYESQIGSSSQPLGKIKNMFQTTNQHQDECVWKTQTTPQTPMIYHG